MHNFKPLKSNGSFINENHTLIIHAATSVNSGYYSCRLNIGKTHATSETVSVHVKGGLILLKIIFIYKTIVLILKPIKEKKNKESKIKYITVLL